MSQGPARRPHFQLIGTPSLTRDRPHEAKSASGMGRAPGPSLGRIGISVSCQPFACPEGAASGSYGGPRRSAMLTALLVEGLRRGRTVRETDRTRHSASLQRTSKVGCSCGGPRFVVAGQSGRCSGRDKARPSRRQAWSGVPVEGHALSWPDSPGDGSDAAKRAPPQGKHGRMFLWRATLRRGRTVRETQRTRHSASLQMTSIVGCSCGGPRFVVAGQAGRRIGRGEAHSTGP